jgi:hypothetical protein
MTHESIWAQPKCTRTQFSLHAHTHSLSIPPRTPALLLSIPLSLRCCRGCSGQPPAMPAVAGRIRRRRPASQLRHGILLRLPSSESPPCSRVPAANPSPRVGLFAAGHRRRCAFARHGRPPLSSLSWCRHSHPRRQPEIPSYCRPIRPSPASASAVVGQGGAATAVSASLPSSPPGPVLTRLRWLRPIPASPPPLLFGVASPSSPLLGFAAAKLVGWQCPATLASSDALLCWITGRVWWWWWCCCSHCILDLDAGGTVPRTQPRRRPLPLLVCTTVSHSSPLHSAYDHVLASCACVWYIFGL